MTVSRQFEGGVWFVLETSKRFETWRKGQGRRLIMNVDRNADEPFDMGSSPDHDVYGLEKGVFRIVFQDGLRPLLEGRPFSRDVFLRAFRDYIQGDDRYTPLLALVSGGRVRVMELFPRVTDEIFEWFVALTKMGEGAKPGMERIVPLTWALDTLNALYVRVAEASPNPGVAEFTLALWSVKYREKLDDRFFAGLTQLESSAPDIWQRETYHVQVQRLGQIRSLCKATDSEIFARYPNMRETVALLRKQQ